MTTWYTHILVSGCPDILDEFQDAYCVDDDTLDFDLNSVVPMPAEIAGGTEAAQIAWRMENWGCSGNAYEVGGTEAAQIERQMENWGCSGNAYEVEDERDYLSIDFLTDDRPPEKVFEAMARRFPRLAFVIYSLDMRDTRTGSRWLLGDGRIIGVHKVTDLNEMREAIRPHMTDQEKRQLAEWCASQNVLFPVDAYLKAIERVICESLAEEAEAQNPRPDKVLL